ncbi:SHOCT domain-containing protein [Natrinema salaciae]|nr:SHOCT domain-containing protein [Natrinema salaciae]
MATDDSLIRTLLIVIAAILLLPVLMMTLAIPMMGVWGGGHMWNGGAWGGTGATWMWLLMSVVPLLVILGLGYLLYSAVRRSGTRGTDPALEELRTAYARGDLTDEEFENRRERLRREEKR